MKTHTCICCIQSSRVLFGFQKLWPESKPYSGACALVIPIWLIEAIWCRNLMLHALTFVGNPPERAPSVSYIEKSMNTKLPKGGSPLFAPLNILKKSLTQQITELPAREVGEQSSKGPQEWDLNPQQPHEDWGHYKCSVCTNPYTTQCPKKRAIIDFVWKWPLVFFQFCSRMQWKFLIVCYTLGWTNWRSTRTEKWVITNIKTDHSSVIM